MNSSSFDAIMAEYQKTRMLADRSQAARKEEIYAQIPEYEQLDMQIITLRGKQSVASIGGDSATVQKLATEIADIQKQKKELLKANHIPADYLDKQYTCPDCRDTGYLEDQSKCHCLIRKMSEVLFDQSGLKQILATENFDALSFDYYEGSDLISFEKTYHLAKNFVQEFANNYRNLFFYGTVGTGKSFLSCCIAREILNQGYEVLYFSSATLFDKIAEYTFRSTEKQMLSAFTERLLSCDLLIIDDLGTELTNAFVSSELFTVLNERNNANKATIISSNIPFGELRDHYSDRIFSRIASNYELIEFSGPDIRMLKKLASKQ